MYQRKPTQRHGAEVAAQMAKKDSAPAGECRKADSAPRWFALGGEIGLHGSDDLMCSLGDRLLTRKLCQLGPVEQILGGPAFASGKLALAFDLDVGTQFDQAALWDSIMEPTVDAWGFDAEQPGCGRYAAQQSNDVLVCQWRIHAPIISNCYVSCQ